MRRGATPVVPRDPVVRDSSRRSGRRLQTHKVTLLLTNVEKKLNRSTITQAVDADCEPTAVKCATGTIVGTASSGQGSADVALNALANDRTG